jgi:hypothetical protein
MAKWIIPTEASSIRFPNEILQEYANELTRETKEKLQASVKESISYLQNDSPRLTYTFLIYISRLKQHYKLFELVQSSENPYPVTLTVYYYTGSEIFDNLISPVELDKKLATLVATSKVTNILGHFLRLSELTEISVDLNFNFDFKTFASLGNVYNPQVPNNLSDFKFAEDLFNSHREVIIESVKETLEMQPGIPSVGAKIQIPVAHLSPTKLITALVFLINRVDGYSIQLSLSEVVKPS